MNWDNDKKGHTGTIATIINNLVSYTIWGSGLGLHPHAQNNALQGLARECGCKCEWERHCACVSVRKRVQMSVTVGVETTHCPTCIYFPMLSTQRKWGATLPINFTLNLWFKCYWGCSHNISRARVKTTKVILHMYRYSTCTLCYI